MTIGQAKKKVAEEGGLVDRQWLCTYEVMAYCNMSEGTLKAARRDWSFPRPIKQGRRKNLFAKSEIDMWLHQRSSTVCVEHVGDLRTTSFGD